MCSCSSSSRLELVTHTEACNTVQAVQPQRRGPHGAPQSERAEFRWERRGAKQWLNKIKYVIIMNLKSKEKGWLTEQSGNKMKPNTGTTYESRLSAERKKPWSWNLESESWMWCPSILPPTDMKHDPWSSLFTASARGWVSAPFHFIPKMTTPNAPMLK